MNQHTLPPSNLREVSLVAPIKSAEKFIMLVGNREPWIFGDMMDRADVIEEVGEHYTILAKVVAFSLESGTCRDATDEIASVVIQRWAEDGKLLTEAAKAWVAMCKGEAFANSFRLEDA